MLRAAIAVPVRIDLRALSESESVEDASGQVRFPAPDVKFEITMFGARIDRALFAVAQRVTSAWRRRPLAGRRHWNKLQNLVLL